MAENSTEGAGKSSLGGLFDKLLTAGTSIYTTQTNAATAKRTAGASVMQSLAEVAKSKTTLIVVGVLVVGAIAFALIRRKK